MSGFEQRPGIYKVVCTANSRHYVGSTTNLHKRYRDHFGALNNGNHRIEDMQVDFDFYGEQYFVFEVCEYCSEDFLLKREQYYLDCDFGFYNTYPTAGSPSGYEHSRKTIEALRTAHNKHKKPVVVIVPETGKVVGQYESIKAAGIDLNINTGSITNICRRKSGWAKEFTFRYAADWDPSSFQPFERLTPSEISGLAKAKSVLQFVQLSSDGLMLVGSYKSLANAERKTGVHSTNIARVCKGKTKTAGGYVWVFKQQLDKEMAA